MFDRIQDKIRHWVLRGQRPSAQYHFPKAGKMFVLPTRFGWMFIVLLLAMFIWSINHQLNLGYAMTFILAVVGSFAIVLTVGQLAELQITAQPPKAVFAGETAIFPLLFSERQGRLRGGVLISTPESETFVADIEADGSVLAEIPIMTVMRGWHPCPILTVKSYYPLGWFVSWQWYQPNTRVLVYPEAVGNRPFPYGILSGQGEQTVLRQGSDEFSGLQTYQRGDSLARVAWKHSVTGEMQVKQFADYGNEEIVFSYEALDGDCEERLSQLTAWVVEANRLGLRYALLLNARLIPANHGDEHLHYCLRALALYGLGDDDA